MDWIPFFERYGFAFKGRGDNRLIICPMHGERNASLSINVRTSLMKCHSCGWGGDAITYLTKEQGRSDKEAIEEIKLFFGITEDKKPRAKPVEKAKPVPQEDARVDIWHQTLLDAPERLEWLLVRRGIDVETVKRHKLGWSPEHGRFVFPIRTHEGIVAIKLYKPDRVEPTPKWIYAEAGGKTALYPESVLTTSERIVICEGELDALLANQKGIVAVTGTGGANAWAPEWSEQLRGKSVVVAYDNDKAGKEGSERVAAALKDVASDVTVIELPVAKPGGDVTDFFMEDGGTVESFWALASETKPTYTKDETAVTEHYVVCSAEAARDAIAKALDPDGPYGMDKFKHAGDHMWNFLFSFGRFYIDQKQAAALEEQKEFIFYFNRVSKELFSLTSPQFGAMISRYLYFSSATPSYPRLLQHIHDRCVDGGAERVNIYRLAHYDAGLRKAYVYRGKNRMFVLDGDNAPREADNGTDGVLFARTADSWEPDFDYDGSPLDDMFADMQIEATAMSPEQLRLMLSVYTVAMAFPEMQMTRLVPMFIGEQGSGKTFSARRIGRLWCGPSWQVSTIESEKEDDFVRQMTSDYAVCADNLDNRISWIQDMLARVATGAEVTRRALYTNGQMWRATISAFLMITTRDPRWIKREDVVQRTLPIHIAKRPDKFLPEVVLQEQESLLRRKRMAHLLNIANGVVAQLRRGEKPSETSLRIADFAFLGQLIAKSMGRGKDFKEAVEILPEEQKRFMALDHPVLDVLEEWLIRNNRGRSIEARELFNEFKELGGWNDRRGIRTWRGLLEKMESLRSEIERRFGPFTITRDDSMKQRVLFLPEGAEGVVHEPSVKATDDASELPF